MNQQEIDTNKIIASHRREVNKLKRRIRASTTCAPSLCTMIKTALNKIDRTLTRLTPYGEDTKQAAA